MNPLLFTREIHLPVPVEEAFAWHERPGAFQRLAPPWQKIQLRHRTGGIRDGDRVELVNQVGPLSFTWLVEHRDYLQNVQFRDLALRGPFTYWNHLHSFKPNQPDTSTLTDRIEYIPPGGSLGQTLGSSFFENQLQQIFRYRQETLAADLAFHKKFADQPRLNIAITGSSGLVGSSLLPFLTTAGHRVEPLRRDSKNPPTWFNWSTVPDAIVHLAGENIGSDTWTEKKKERIRKSRVDGTAQLCEMILHANPRPKVLICASAVGFYGDRQDEWLDESSTPGNGFLADVCQEWEKATEPLQQANIRVVHLRFGIILTPQGGALAKMLPAFRFYLGGRLASGKQYWSWVSIDDVIQTILHALMTDSLEGPLNLVAPNPLTNAAFSQILAKVLNRTSILPVPELALKKLLGQMAEELLLASARVSSQKLIDSGYTFRDPTLDEALRRLLGQLPINQSPAQSEST